MIDAYYEGNDVVYGVRSSRKKDTCFKRGTAHLFYKLMSFLGADIVYDHADYRLLSRRATENLLNFDEVNLFLRGIVPMIGFQSTTVEYERGERFAGESKYPLGKMITFAFEGITSLSVKPIRMITIGGLLICLISLGMLIKSFVDYFNGNVVPGWASIMVSIWVLGGLQIFAIGIIGEYIGKTSVSYTHLDHIFSCGAQMIDYKNHEILDNAGDLYTAMGWACLLYTSRCV